jgi:hypothetical protein
MERDTNGSADLEPRLMAALAARGADILESGVREYEPWCAKLFAGFGEKYADKVRVHLCQIYDASREELWLRHLSRGATHSAGHRRLW